jgi:hypothetical protein
MVMDIQIFETTAWREFISSPSNKGLNQTTHLAKIAGLNGKLHDCYVKLLEPSTPALLCEAIGWLVARSTGVTCSPFACIVFIPINELRKNMNLPSWLDNYEIYPAWCSEVVRGKSVIQVHKWLLVAASKKCLQSKDAKAIAAMDVWTDNQDRNYGNVVCGSNGKYVSIDHETLLHDLLWRPAGRVFEKRSLVDMAAQHLLQEECEQFHVEMAINAQRHQDAFNASKLHIVNVIEKITDPLQSQKLVTLICDFLELRAKSGWLANEIGVIV